MKKEKDYYYYIVWYNEETMEPEVGDIVPFQTLSLAIKVAEQMPTWARFWEIRIADESNQGKIVKRSIALKTMEMERRNKCKE